MVWTSANRARYVHCRAVTELNAEVDSLLLQIWNEVEHHFSDLPPCERMNKCCEYGVVYYTRAAPKLKR